MVAGGEEGAASVRHVQRGLAVRHLRSMDMSAAEFLIAIAIAAGISMLTFRHADKHGSTHATAWGIGAFLAAGIVVPVYAVRFWLRKRRPTA